MANNNEYPLIQGSYGVEGYPQVAPSPTQPGMMGPQMARYEIPQQQGGYQVPAQQHGHPPQQPQGLYQTGGGGGGMGEDPARLLMQRLGPEMQQWVSLRIGGFFVIIYPVW